MQVNADNAYSSPLLIGVLVDVSGSMTSSIQNQSGNYQTRLEAFRDSLEGLIQRASDAVRDRSRESQPIRVRLFAYGFGFGNLLSDFLGKKGASVRNLLALPGTGQRTIEITQLADNWMQYRQHVERLTPEMFGSTPMKTAFDVVQSHFKDESGASPEARILLVVSDGDPDESPEVIAATAEALKETGVLIVSCYVTDQDVTEPRTLYENPAPHWPNGARLMHACASEVPSGSPFEKYLREFKWTAEARARLFTQINQSEVLSEFMNVVLSPLSPRFAVVDSPPELQAQPPLREISRATPASGGDSTTTVSHETAPESVQKALLQALWQAKRPFRLGALILAGVALAAFAVWSSLPDATKGNLISWFFSR